MSRSQTSSKSGSRAREEILRWRNAINRHTLVDPHRATPSVHDDPILPSQESQRHHTHGDPWALSRQERPSHSSSHQQRGFEHRSDSRHPSSHSPHTTARSRSSHNSRSPPNPPSTALYDARSPGAEPRPRSSSHSLSPLSAQSTSYILGSGSNYIVRPRRHQAIVIPHANGGYVVVPPLKGHVVVRTSMPVDRSRATTQGKYRM